MGGLRRPSRRRPPWSREPPNRPHSPLGCRHGLGTLPRAPQIVRVRFSVPCRFSAKRELVQLGTRASRRLSEATRPPSESLWQGRSLAAGFFAVLGGMGGVALLTARSYRLWPRTSSGRGAPPATPTPTALARGRSSTAWVLSPRKGRRGGFVLLPRYTRWQPSRRVRARGRKH